MACRKGLKTCTVSGIGTALPITGITVANGQNVDVDEIAAYGDSEYTSVPRQIKHNSDLTVTCLNETGVVDASYYALIGTVQAVTITYTMSDGKVDAADTSLTHDFVIMGIEGSEIEVDGDRKTTIEITIRKHGPTASN